MKTDGGPAFPGTIPNPGEVHDHFFGMSLRDHFAGQALQGIIACVRDHVGATTIKDRCAKAYEYADAMLAEREKFNN